MEGGFLVVVSVMAVLPAPPHLCSSAYLLNVVVAQRPAILELLAGEDQSLLVGRDSFLVLDLGLDVVDGVGRLHLEGDGLAREGLDEAVIRCQLRCSFFHLHPFSLRVL